MMDDQLRFLFLIVERLDVLDVAYMLTGSTALSVYGTPRMTRDVDLVVELRRGDVQPLVDNFPDCVIYREDVSEAVRSRRMFNIIHSEWLVKADFIVRKLEPYRTVEFSRRRRISLEGQPVWVVAPEDLILSKLCWAMGSDSAMQKRDVETLIKSPVKLDWEYLEKWASALGAELPERFHE